MSKLTSDSSDGPSGVDAKSLLARAGLPDEKNWKRGLTAICLLAPPETVLFDYEAFREDSSLDQYFTKSLSGARENAIRSGGTLTLKEMQRWHAGRVFDLLEAWAIGIGFLFEVQSSSGSNVYALHLVSGGGLECRDWFFGPWATKDSAQQDLGRRGAFIGWFPPEEIPSGDEEIMAWESEAGIWAAYESEPPSVEPVVLFPVVVDRKTGFIDQAGHVVISPRFSGLGYRAWISVTGPLGFFDEGLAPIWVGNRIGYIDSAGSIVIPPMFGRATAFSEGLAAVQTGDINTKEVLSEMSQGYRLDLWCNVPSGPWGYINRTGRLALPFCFDAARPFRDGLGLVEVEGKWGYVDRFGNPFLRAQWDAALPFCKGVAAVKEGRAWGLIGREGRYVVQPEYTEIKQFSSGLAPACKDTRWGFIDSGGTMRIGAEFDDAAPFSEGLAAVNCGGRTGFIDRQGHFVIPPKLEHAMNFSEGFAPACDGRTWGYISCSGDWLIALQFERVNGFRQGLAAVSQNGRWGYVNSAGEFVWFPTV